MNKLFEGDGQNNTEENLIPILPLSYSLNNSSIVVGRLGARVSGSRIADFELTAARFDRIEQHILLIEKALCDSGIDIDSLLATLPE